MEAMFRFLVVLMPVVLQFRSQSKLMRKISPYLAFALLLSLTACQDVGSDNPPDIAPPTGDEEGILYSVAGMTGEPGSDGDGGPALEAHLNKPQDVTFGRNGELFIVDWENHCIRLVDTNGTISRHIGSGNLGDGTSGPAGTADLDEPSGITIGPIGEYWV